MRVYIAQCDEVREHGFAYPMARRCPKCHPISRWWRAVDVAMVALIVVLAWAG